MIELRLELQPYYDERDDRQLRSAGRTCWSSSSSHSHQREVAFRGPTLPCRSAALEKDTFEFGAVRLREFEL